jgi:hypothetical protein
MRRRIDGDAVRVCRAILAECRYGCSPGGEPLLEDGHGAALAADVYTVQLGDCPDAGCAGKTLKESSSIIRGFERALTPGGIPRRQTAVDIPGIEPALAQ